MNEEFKKGYLNLITAFYPSMDAWLLAKTNAKTIDELDKARKEGRLEEKTARFQFIR